MIPDGPIQVYGGWENVYLIEARSIGGISGAPVFTRPEVMQRVNVGTQEHNGLFHLDSHLFIGMIRGHWDIDGDVNEQNPQPGRKGVNMGIAMVVPAYRILEALNHPALAAHRDEFERRIALDEIASEDSSSNRVNLGPSLPLLARFLPSHEMGHGLDRRLPFAYNFRAER